jgi:hypothetical protein
MAIYTGESGAALSDWPMEAHDAGATGNLNGEVLNNDHPPVVHLSKPLDNSMHDADFAVKLVATAADMEDGDLSDLIEWWKIDHPVRQLGIGKRVAADLEPGEHQIAAFVRDSGSNLSSDSVSLRVSGALTGLELHADVRSPAVRGREVFLTADIDELDRYEFKFLRKKIGEDVREVLQDFSDIPVHVLDTSGMNGEYHLIAVARDKSDHSMIYRRFLRYWVNLNNPLTGLDIDFINGAGQKQGAAHRIGADAQGKDNGDIAYRFEYRHVDDAKWKLLQDYSTAPVVEVQLPLGHYRVRVQARSANTEDKPVVAVGSFWVNSQYKLDAVSLTAEQIYGLYSRTSYLIEARAWSKSQNLVSLGQTVEYEFRIRFPGETGRFRTLREYSTVNAFKFITPNGVQPGNAELQVLARIAGTGDRPVAQRIPIYVSDASSGFGLTEIIGEPQ